MSLAPNLKPVTDLLGVDAATVKKVLAAWGPGKFDAELFLDGKGFRPDGKTAATLIPPAYGLAGVEPPHVHRLGLGPVLERVRRDPRDARPGQLLRRAPRQRAEVPGRRAQQDGPHALQRRQGPLQAARRCRPTSCRSPRRSRRAGRSTRPPRSAARRSSTARATCASCHMPPTFSEPGNNLHTPASICTDDFQAQRSPTNAYRTTPLGGLGTRTKGGYYHDGRYRTLGQVVAALQQLLRPRPDRQRAVRRGRVPEEPVIAACLDAECTPPEGRDAPAPRLRRGPRTVPAMLDAVADPVRLRIVRHLARPRHGHARRARRGRGRAPRTRSAPTSPRWRQADVLVSTQKPASGPGPPGVGVPPRRRAGACRARTSSSSPACSPRRSCAPARTRSRCERPAPTGAATSSGRPGRRDSRPPSSRARLSALGSTPTVDGETVRISGCPCAVVSPDHPEIVCALATGLVEGVLAASGSDLRVGDHDKHPEAAALHAAPDDAGAERRRAATPRGAARSLALGRNEVELDLDHAAGDAAHREAHPAEELAGGAVLGQRRRLQPRDAVGAGVLDEQAGERRADPAALPRVGDRERDVGDVAPADAAAYRATPTKRPRGRRATSAACVRPSTSVKYAISLPRATAWARGTSASASAR